MTALLWCLIAVPLAVGAGLAVSGRRADRWAPAIALAVSTVLVVLALIAAVARPAVRAPFLAGLPLSFGVDGLSAVMVVLVAAVSAAVLAFAAAESGATGARARFFGLLLVFVAAMLATVTAESLLGLLMAWEVMGAASYALIGFGWRESWRVSSGAVAFVTTRTADLGLYLAAGAALAAGHGLSLDELSGLPAPWLHLATAGIVVAALGKSAQLPFSFWLSRAMAGSSPVSALLHSATMVAAGAYLLLRIQPLLASAGWAGPAVAWIGVTTALLLGMVALTQRDLKQVLAASTCSQVGFLVLAAGTGPDGRAGGVAQLVAHAAVKSLLFLVAGAFLTALGTKDLAALRGAGRRFPLTGALFAVGALALGGVPPTALWVTKDAVLAAAGQHSAGLYAAGLAAAVVSAGYAARILGHVLGRPGSRHTAGYDTERPGTRTITARMIAPLLPLAVGAAVLGIVGIPAVWTPLTRLTGGAPLHLHPVELAVSGGLALAVTAIVLRAPARRTVGAPFTDWLGLERLARVLVATPTLAVARACARADDRIVDGTVRTAARATRTLATLTRTRLERSIEALVGTVVRAARRLGGWARRPQTGIPHQYYAQAVAVLIIVSVFVLLVR